MDHEVEWITSHRAMNLSKPPWSSCERLRMIKLDDCSILQRDHLVGSREDLESMTQSAFTESHNLKTPHAQASVFGRATDEHSVDIGMGSKPDCYEKRSRYTLRLGQVGVLDCPVRQAPALRHKASGTRKETCPGKTLPRQTEEGQH